MKSGFFAAFVLSTQDSWSFIKSTNYVQQTVMTNDVHSPHHQHLNEMKMREKSDDIEPKVRFGSRLSSLLDQLNSSGPVDFGFVTYCRYLISAVNSFVFNRLRSRLNDQELSEEYVRRYFSLPTESAIRTARYEICVSLHQIS